jgi:hypothetical protein
MNTTMKTLFALTIAAAALATTVLPSSALPNGRPGEGTSSGPHPAPTQPPKATPAPIWTKQAGLIGTYLGTHGITCLACNLPHPTPVQPPAGGHGDNWGNGWNHGYGRNRGYGWRDRPEIYVEGQPQAIAVSAPVQSAPANASAAAPQAAALQQAAEPCNCLTKQSLPDGSVLFQDICTKESAIAAPMTVGAR